MNGVKCDACVSRLGPRGEGARTPTTFQTNLKAASHFTPNWRRDQVGASRSYYNPRWFQCFFVVVWRFLSLRQLFPWGVECVVRSRISGGRKPLCVGTEKTNLRRHQQVRRSGYQLQRRVSTLLSAASLRDPRKGYVPVVCYAVVFDLPSLPSFVSRIYSNCLTCLPAFLTGPKSPMSQLIIGLARLFLGQSSRVLCLLLQPTAAGTERTARPTDSAARTSVGCAVTSPMASKWRDRQTCGYASRMASGQPHGIPFAKVNAISTVLLYLIESSRPVSKWNALI